MSPLIDMHMVKAIADLAIFLEFSDDNVLDADASVAAREQLASELQLMSLPAKANFVMQMRGLATRYRDDEQEFVLSLPEALGLI